MTFRALKELVLVALAELPTQLPLISLTEGWVADILDGRRRLEIRRAQRQFVLPLGREAVSAVSETWISEKIHSVWVAHWAASEVFPLTAPPPAAFQDLVLEAILSWLNAFRSVHV